MEINKGIVFFLLLSITVVLLAIGISTLIQKRLKNKRAIKWLSIAMILIVFISSAFIILKNRQEHNEWYSMKSILIENNKNIKKAQLNLNNGFYNLPWIDINFYVDDIISFSEAEIMFKDFLKNYTEDFFNEISQKASAYTINVYIMTCKDNGLRLYGFKADKSSDYKIWRITKSVETDKINTEYNLENYQ